MNRRRLLLAWASLLALFVWAPGLWDTAAGAAGANPRVFVFVSTDIRARALEGELQAALSGLEVRVFSRIRELKDAVRQQAPEAVLARTVVLRSLGLTPRLQGRSAGSDREPYVLLSVQTPVQPADLDGKKLGTVNLLERDETEKFVSRVLQRPSPELKTVTSEGDLLTLLQFGAVAAVLLPQRWVKLLQEKSKLDLRTTVLATQVELPAVAFASESARSVIEPKIRALNGKLNGRLGVDGWE